MNPELCGDLQPRLHEQVHTDNIQKADRNAHRITRERMVVHQLEELLQAASIASCML